MNGKRHMYKVIGCKVLQRELAWTAVHCRNTLDITMMRQKLHNTPGDLRDALQAEIDRIESGEDLHSEQYDRGTEPEAILLAYGLCANALCGLQSKKYPLVIPRAHDCTTLFMGSKEAYADYFMKVKGTFFATEGWVEHGLDIHNEAKLQARYEEYMEKYDDEDVVEDLMEMERSLVANYHAITYIHWDGLPDAEGREAVREITEKIGWDLHDYQGNARLMQRLVDGDWDTEDFLILQPGETLQPSYDEAIIERREGAEA